MFDRLRARGFDILARNHAEAILAVDFPEQAGELVSALEEFTIPLAEIVASGGGEAPATQRLRRRLADLGWAKHNFMLETRIDGVTRAAFSHEIDHVRRTPAGRIALEIEWNNKDPFFDRDLENFQRLHALSAISLGIVITRGAGMQAVLEQRIARFLEARGIARAEDLAGLGMKRRTDRQMAALARRIGRGEPFAPAFARVFMSDKFGAASTHWAKLEARVARGVGNPCPLVLIGLPAEALGEAEAYSAARPLL